MDNFLSLLVKDPSSCTVLGSTNVMCVYVLVVIIDAIPKSHYGKRMFKWCHVGLEF